MQFCPSQLPSLRQTEYLLSIIGTFRPSTGSRNPLAFNRASPRRVGGHGPYGKHGIEAGQIPPPSSAGRGWEPRNANAARDALTYRVRSEREGPLSRSAGRGPGTGRAQGRAGAEPPLVREPDLERGAGGGRRGRRGGPRWPRTLLLVSGRRPPPPALAAPSPRPAPAAAPGRSPGTRSPGTRCGRSHLGQDEGPAGAAEGQTADTG